MAQMRRCRMNPIKRSIAYFPCLIVVSVILWPDIEVIIREHRLPAIGIFTFSVRVTEIIFASLFFLYAMWRIIILSLKPGVAKRSDRLSYLIYFNKPYLRFILPSLIALFAYALAAAVLKQSSYTLLDLRGLSYVLFLPMFYNSVKSGRTIVRVIRILYTLLFFMACLNVVASLTSWGHSWGRASNLTIIMSFYLFCLALSFVVFRQGNLVVNICVLLVATLAALTTLAKFMALGFLVGVTAAVVISFLTAKARTLRHVAVFGFLISVVYGLFSLTDVTDVLSKTHWGQYDIANFQEYVRVRLLREDVGDVSGGRFEIWRVALGEVQNHPVLGNGLGEYSRIIEELENRFGEYVGVHNLALWILIRTGAVGAVLVLVLLIRMMRIGLDVMKGRRKRRYRSIAQAQLMFVLGYLAMNMVSLFFFNFELSIIFWGSVAILFSMYRISVAEEVEWSKAQGRLGR